MLWMIVIEMGLMLVLLVMIVMMLFNGMFIDFNVRLVRVMVMKIVVRIVKCIGNGSLCCFCVCWFCIFW